MRVVVQRVSEARVTVEGNTVGSIGSGLLILLGIETEDEGEDADWLCRKIAQLRVFNDDKGIMNLSVQDVSGELMVISQFTLHAKTKKGNRPSYIRAAAPGKAIPMYHRFIATLEEITGKKVAAGEFGAAMEVSLTNSGPVTLLIDTKNKE
jgi:D-aminoacyl-tRNA deacylase